MAYRVTPRLVIVPEGVSMSRAEDAVMLCGRMGLLEPSGTGLWLMPQEVLARLDDETVSKFSQFLELPAPEPPERQ